MRPPPEGGGYGDTRILRPPGRDASMRPPPEGGGYAERCGQRPRRGRCFNEAAARGRRIYAKLLILLKIYISFNEAAARGRRICDDNSPYRLDADLLQ